MARHFPQLDRRHLDGQRSNRHRSSSLHPLLYRTIAGAALWLVLSAWGFFGTGYSDFALAVVSGLVLGSVLLPLLLWRIWRHERDRQRRGDGEAESFHDWLLGEFDIWQTRIKGTDAAVAILLPLAAVAVGMTIFAVVKHLAVG